MLEPLGHGFGADLSFYGLGGRGALRRARWGACAWHWVTQRCARSPGPPASSLPWSSESVASRLLVVAAVAWSVARHCRLGQGRRQPTSTLRGRRPSGRQPALDGRTGLPPATLPLQRYLQEGPVPRLGLTFLLPLAVAATSAAALESASRELERTRRPPGSERARPRLEESELAQCRPSAHPLGAEGPRRLPQLLGVHLLQLHQHGALAGGLRPEVPRSRPHPDRDPHRRVPALRGGARQVERRARRSTNMGSNTPTPRTTTPGPGSSTGSATGPASSSSTRRGTSGMKAMGSSMLGDESYRPLARRIEELLRRIAFWCLPYGDVADHARFRCAHGDTGYDPPAGCSGCRNPPLLSGSNTPRPATAPASPSSPLPASGSTPVSSRPSSFPTAPCSASTRRASPPTRPTSPSRRRCWSRDDGKDVRGTLRASICGDEPACRPFVLDL